MFISGKKKCLFISQLRRLRPFRLRPFRVRTNNRKRTISSDIRTLDSSRTDFITSCSKIAKIPPPGNWKSDFNLSSLDFTISSSSSSSNFFLRLHFALFLNIWNHLARFAWHSQLIHTTQHFPLLSKISSILIGSSLNQSFSHKKNHFRFRNYHFRFRDFHFRLWKFYFRLWDFHFQLWDFHFRSRDFFTSGHVTPNPKSREPLTLTLSFQPCNQAFRFQKSANLHSSCSSRDPNPAFWLVESIFNELHLDSDWLRSK